MSNHKNSNLLVGLILLIVGGYFLLRNLGWIPYYFKIDWDLIWPIALLFFGVYLIVKHKR
jgi:hypothetical protein